MQIPRPLYINTVQQAHSSHQSLTIITTDVATFSPSHGISCCTVGLKQNKPLTREKSEKQYGVLLLVALTVLPLLVVLAIIILPKLLPSCRERNAISMIALTH